MRIHISRAGNVTEEVKNGSERIIKSNSQVIAILLQHRAHIFQAGWQQMRGGKSKYCDRER